MKRVPALLAWTMSIYAILALPSCGGNPLGPAYSSELSGLWTGTIVFVQMGSCTMGGDSIATSPVEMDWDVSRSGALTVVEDPSGRILKGTTEPDSTVRLRETTPITCNGVTRTMTADYEGKVVFRNSALELDMEGTEEWCPDMGCVFRVRYEISKPR
jgi:hypothetical protein